MQTWRAALAHAPWTWTVLILTGVIFFVLPIPHTNSLRNLAALGLLVTLSTWMRRQRHGGVARDAFAHPVLVGYVLFLLWMLLVALGISTETQWSLGEIKSQWLPATLYGITGLMLGVFANRHGDRVAVLFVMVIIAVLGVHLLATDLLGITRLVELGHIPRAAGLTDGPDKASYLTLLLLALLGSEAICRISYRKPFLLMGTAWLYGFAILLGIGILLEGSRNGALVGILLILLSAPAVLFTSRRGLGFKLGLTVGAAAILLSIIIFNFLSDPRWKSLQETVPIAWDIETHQAWKDIHKYPLPLTSDGTPVSHSNYVRIAWIHVSLQLIRDNPLGVGFGRNAFSHAYNLSHPEDPMGTTHSHSGLLDIAVGTGVPGALLLYGWLLALVLSAARHHRRHRDYFSLALILVTCNYLLRSLLDSTIRDHMLLTYLLLSGFLFTAMKLQRQDTTRSGT